MIRRHRHFPALTSATLGIAVAALTACTATDVGGPVVEVTNDPPATPTIDDGFAHLEPRSRALPVVNSFGGQVLGTPKVLPIYFTGDTREAKLSPFFSALAGSKYWADAVGDYGVDALTVSPTAHLSPTLPAATTDAKLRTWLQGKFADATLPPFDPQTIYTVFLPTYVVVATANGRTCVDFDAYHGELTVGGQQAPFVVVAKCTYAPQGDGYLTRRVSGLLVDTATNPLPETAPAFAGADPRGVGWFLGSGAEVSDRCSSEDQTGLLDGFAVARSWSNSSATAGREPCLPAPSVPYFNAEPVFPDMVPMLVGNKQVEAPALVLGLDEERTIEVDAFAEAAMDWTLEAQDAATLAGKQPELVFAFDDTKAAPFKVRHLTVRRVRAASSGGLSPFVIVSSAGGTTHQWWGVVSQ